MHRRGIAQRIVRLMANLVYRDIDVLRPEGLAIDGPVLAVANHFGGLSDGVLLVDSLPRLPRVVARDAIWRIPVAGSLASAIGMIPVHRSTDRGPGSNDAMFRSAYEALGAEDLVLIFPEGVTQDVPHMAQLRTGAARIALGAQAAGVAGLRVLPVGLHYEDKAGFRTRALVNLGEPIDLDAWAADRAEGRPQGADDQQAVRELTTLVDRRLRLVAPDFPDWPTVGALHTAAEAVLNDVDPAAPPDLQYGDLEVVAARMHRAGEPAVGALVRAAQTYRVALHQARASDHTLAPSSTRRAGSLRWLVDLAVVVLLAPFALVGLMAAALPLLLVLAVSKLPVSPAVRATAVPAIALLTFLIEWALFAWRGLSDQGWDLGLVAVLLFPFYVGALFVVVERAQALLRRWRRSGRPGDAELERLRALRAEVTELGWASL